MVRPVGRPMARKAITLEDLREEFLVHCEARNPESPLLVPPSMLDPVSQAQAGGFTECVRNCYMQNLQCRANAQDEVDFELCEMILKGCVEECRRRYGTRTVTSADASLILNSLTLEQILESLTQTNVSPYVG